MLEKPRELLNNVFQFVSPMKITFARVAILVLACSTVACRHDSRRAEEFAKQVRCGMTDGEVRELAVRFGVSSNRIWRQQSFAPNVLTVKPGELDFVDILLQGGEAVAVQRGNYIAFTTGMEFGTVRMLCGAAPLSDRTLRDYDSRKAAR